MTESDPQPLHLAELHRLVDLAEAMSERGHPPFDVAMEAIIDQLDRASVDDDTGGSTTLLSATRLLLSANRLAPGSLTRGPLLAEALGMIRDVLSNRTR